MKLYTLKNMQNAPRWIWPKESSKPLFINFYSALKLKQRIIKGVLKALSMKPLSFLIFKAIEVPPETMSELPKHSQWSLFNGTIGPNRKQVLYEEIPAPSYTKICKTKQAQFNLENEYKTLKALEQTKINLGFNFPKVIVYQKNKLKVSAMDKKEEYQEWTTLHSNFIRGTYFCNYEIQKLGKCESWLKSVDIINRLNGKSKVELAPFVKDLQLLANEFSQETEIITHFGHGDFTPWNSFIDKAGNFCVIDWELANKNLPAGFDLFHFICQTEIMLGKRNCKVAFDKIYCAAQSSLLFKDKKEIEFYLKLYLFHHISYYLNIYQEQNNWHKQVTWQIQFWTEMLSSLIAKGKQRQLFIRELFKNLSNVSYACLKCPTTVLSNLSENADIDILVLRKDHKSIISKIKENRWVEKVDLSAKGSLKQVTIYFKDGSRLNLDLIFELKRKSIVFMDTEYLIKNAEIIAHGIKSVDAKNTARFLGLFYALNDTQIPQKYFHFSQFIRYSKLNMDQLLWEFYSDKQEVKNKIQAIINKQPENLGLKKFKNTLLYLKSNLLNYGRQRGFMVTFSGVDGAGKSTVIEETKYKLEKKYRKRVKVLRHRPSIVPILSSFIHGKSKAEKKSADSLPRMGTNNSHILSILRFTYYYFDYVFGQFYVYLRYICQDYIVLYDRYYYDMIADPRRSNINISPKLSFAGLKLLIKPRFNFFLYAPAEEILKRKQELNGTTIKELTNNYINIFKNLASKDTNANFSCIENIELEQTNLTIDKILSKAL